jgi:hypothetical protein
MDNAERFSVCAKLGIDKARESTMLKKYFILELLKAQALKVNSPWKKW